MVEGLVTCGFELDLRIYDHTKLHDFGGVLDSLSTLSFGLSLFHGHGFWLVCEVAFRRDLLLPTGGGSIEVGLLGSPRNELCGGWISLIK